MAEPFLAEVVFPLPLRRAFDYRVPPTLDAAIRPGHRVWAPFGARGRKMGIVVRRHPAEGAVRSLDSLKTIDAPVESDVALPEREIALARWMADRYWCSLGEAAFTVSALGRKLPPKRPVPPRTPEARERPAPFNPTPDQQGAIDVVVPAVRAGGFRPFLIHGVAAAGKTEVYRRAIEGALEGGRGAILFVPEIGLTPQMEDLFRRWFGAALEVWHSHIADGDRWRIWRRARSGECRLVIGPRSALFVPVTPLGLIVVDEEHDASYKQDSAPHYHARDVAWEKARLHGATLLLGSATPSLETLQAAREGRVESLALPRRVDDRPFPAVRLIDTRKAGWYISDELVNAIRDRLAKKEQSLLFLNRRGYATRLRCRACEWESRCPRCAVSLVLHRDPPADALRCHLCEHSEPPPDRCPQCRGEMIKATGRGTQKVLKDLATLFPAARLLRWDRDAMSRRGSQTRAYESVRAGDVDIVVGTQMVAQGHDFPRLTLVGVLDADSALRLPDFRAAERTFQLITQVAGRAGRADRPGEVIVQTRHPDHYALRSVQSRDPASFVEEELSFRREAGYPPFARLAMLRVRAVRADRAEAAAEALTRTLESPDLPDGAAILGPAPAFHERREDESQWQVLLKATPALFPEILQRLEKFEAPTGVSLSVNVDPEDLD